ncbi:efflux RND transporter periplasmic adaptor subunit [Sphingomonas sp. BT-65]|uniref:efflux RND transporter periplasmic adaptor subunit n=1 Tax=Sphingomonas sp. BT-65 TaxID=2989821 RepID=UPI00223563DC|nr:efflux RND transporter periplasmic adaptor subunit [Sphingomonas sp. BT-65]MCW4461508.1 efflux RND transporter periplasmic adaptor subunit [Sphingomonas sp. BT-65]
MTDTATLLQFARARRKPALLVGGVGLLALAALAYSGTGQTQQQPAAQPPVPVRTVAAERRDVRHEIEAVGTVESLQNVVVRSQVDGILTRLHFAEGDLVRRGQLLATIDDRPQRAALEAAQAQLARDSAQLRAAELDLARYQSLVARNAISQQLVDQQRAQADQLRATVRLDSANVDTARVNLSYTRIVSPVSGRVGIRRVDAGNLVRTSDADGIVSVAQVNPISIVFPVPQSRLADLRTSARDAQGAVVEAYDSDGGALLGTGRITAFDNAFDTRTGTGRVRAQFANGAERLAPGAFVAVRMRTGLTPGAVVLPAVAVRPGVEGHFVYRVTNGTVKRVPVTLGYTNDEVAVVARGIAPGNVIVRDGFSRLRDGAKVTIADTGAGTGTAGAGQ